MIASPLFVAPDQRRPGLDNQNTLVLDALVGIVHEDDSRIAELTLRRGYDRGNPRIKILLGSPSGVSGAQQVAERRSRSMLSTPLDIGPPSATNEGLVVLVHAGLYRNPPQFWVPLIVLNRYVLPAANGS
jgi:hypothetical protein